MKKLFILMLFMLMTDIHCQWIDPHDMNIKVKEKYMNPSPPSETSLKTTSNGETNINPDLFVSYLKRVVGVLMNSAHIDKKDPTVYHGHIRFNLDPDDYDFLITFGKEDLRLARLRKLDTILSESFKRSLVNEYLDKLESFQLNLYSTIVNIYNLWILGVIFLLYFVYQLFKNNFSFAYILKYLIILVFICDYGFRYRNLLEEAEEHNSGVVYSAKCDPAKMSWGEWTIFLWSRRDCEIKTATPLDVLLYQVKNLIIVPLHAVGTGLGGFGYNMFTTLPWGLNLVMWPLMLIFVIIVFVFTMVICTGEAIEFNISPIFKLKIGGSRRAHTENVLTGSTVERLMDQLHQRPVVQNIHIAVPAGDNKEQEGKSDNLTSDQDLKPIGDKSKLGSGDKSEETERSLGNETKLSNNESNINSSVEANHEIKTPKADVLEDTSQDTRTDASKSEQHKIS